MKHLSTNGRKGKKVTILNDNTASLIVKDNGVGMKDPSKITKNLGCEIIKSLTRQLEGQISLLDEEKGTGYKLLFPIEMEHTIE